MSAVMTSMQSAVKSGCLLCGRRASHAAVWGPTAEWSAKLGAAAGKRRLVVYALCPKCVRKPGTMTRVEDKVLADAKAALLKPEAN